MLFVKYVQRLQKKAKYTYPRELPEPVQITTKNMSSGHLSEMKMVKTCKGIVLLIVKNLDFQCK